MLCIIAVHASSERPHLVLVYLYIYVTQQPCQKISREEFYQRRTRGIGFQGSIERFMWLSETDKSSTPFLDPILTPTVIDDSFTKHACEAKNNMLTHAMPITFKHANIWNYMFHKIWYDVCYLHKYVLHNA